MADESDGADNGAVLITALARMRLIAPGEQPRIEALTGGVSSDIWKVQTRERAFAVKRARAKLKVAADWRAPVARNAYEVKWFRAAAAAVPGSVPDILGEERAAGLFAMTYLDPGSHPVWKNELRDARVDVAFAAEVGRRLATIHATAAADPSTPAEFATDVTFHAIRLEPYLEATARLHADVAPQLMALSRDTLATKRTLVHGDVSPKNILVGPRGPVFLDAECAWYGDPAFDLAFCLNHLLLKCLWTPQAAPKFLASFDALATAYLAAVTWEAREAVERRGARLLPGLFLARADGKSPAEYLTESDKPRVRRVALPLIASPPLRIADIRTRWAQEVGAQ
jgi:aminoglycoside phosphotransferase (APT) family kinase protein